MNAQLTFAFKSSSASLALAVLLAPALAGAQPSASPYTHATRYDAVGRITGTIAPDPGSTGRFAAVRNTYDAAGRLIRVETGDLSSWQSESVAPAAWSGFTIFNRVETSYDSLGRKLRDVSSSIGWPLVNPVQDVRNVTQFSYDLAGRLECTAVRMNPLTFPSVSGAGGSLPATACQLGNNSTTYGHDRITSTVYDAAGQPLQVREAEGTGDEAAEVTYDYNLNGKITTVIDANGNRATMRYDGHDRQDRWTFPSATGPGGFNAATPALALATAGSVNASDYEEYGYDSAGNRTSFRRRDGMTLSYQYDALNRMTVKVVPDRAGLDAAHERDVYYAYDLRNLQTAARFDSLAGEGVTNMFDGFGRLSSTTNNMGGNSRTLSFLHDSNGNRTRITHPGGTIFTSDYDGLNRLSQQREGTAGTILTNFTYNWLGLVETRLNRSNAAGSSTMLYDGVGRLTSLAHDLALTANDFTATFAYNPANQIYSTTRGNDIYAFTGRFNGAYGYGINGRNQLTSVVAGTNTISVPSDANGNVTGDGWQTYLYDVENRLVRTVVNSSGVTATLTYDPLGRLFQIVTPSATRQLLYDGDELVAQYDGANNLLDRWAHGTGADDPVVWYSVGSRRFLQADHLGSIVAVSSDSGTLVGAAPNRYDEYGVPMGINQGRFQFTGQIWLPEVQAYYYKARMYSPNVGRFIQTDPIGYEGGLNLYAYVNNDPVNLSDPSGECVVDPGTGAQRGVCGTTEVSRDFVNQRLNDPHSQYSTLEREAVARGNLVRIELVMGSNLIHGSGTFPGDSPGDSDIFIDVGETVRLDNLDTAGNITTSRMQTLPELAEHEGPGHALDAVRNPEAARGRGISGERNSIDAENRYRERAGIPFRRAYNAVGVICTSRGQCPR